MIHVVTTLPKRCASSKKGCDSHFKKVIIVTQDSNAGERDVPQTDGQTEAPAPQEVKLSQEEQDMADGHRYQSQEFRDARDAAKGSERKFSKDAKPKRAGKDGGKEGGKGAPKLPAKTERIAKVLARAGLASRREVERLIGLGKIAVNGRILETPAVLVSSTDVITVEGQPIGKAEPTRLWRYHKPVGLMTTHSDPQGRPTVFEKLPQPMPRVISVGRLDLNSEGLLLLTNDGELARALEMPSTAWVRQYRARALGHATQVDLDRLKNGTTVDGVIYGPMEATLDKRVDKADGRANIWLTVSITEGKNREVRKVLESIGLKVNRLIRLAYGPFLLGNLEPGDAEEVGPRVIRELLSDKIDPRNLPPEGASQTRDAGMGRPRDASEGRRGGGDRFAGRDAGYAERPAKPAYGKKPRPEFVEKREYKDRDFDERPRFEGDGESRDRREERPRSFAPRSFTPRTGDRPYAKKPWTPRPERADREEGAAPRKWTPRPETGSEDRAPRGRPERSFKPREARDDRGGDRPRSSSPRPYARDGIPAGEAGAYERAKREFGGGDRPKRDFGDRPKRDFGDRPQGERSFKPREGRDDRGGERKSYGDRPSRPQGERNFRPREDREGGERKSYGDRGGERKSYGDRPSRPQSERNFRPREDGERKSYGDKPRFDRGEGGADRGGFKSARPGGFESGPRAGGKPDGGYKSGGFKPGGAGRPSGGGRPGGKPGGFDRKPRRD